MRNFTSVAARMILAVFWEALQRHTPAADYHSLGGNDLMVAEAIEARYGKAAAERMLGSKQFADTLPYGLLDSIDKLMFPFTLGATLVAVVAAIGRRWKAVLSIAGLAVAGYFANTLLCATGSGVFDRYQSRVTWLLPWAVCLIALRLIVEYRGPAPMASEPGDRPPPGERSGRGNGWRTREPAG